MTTTIPSRQSICPQRLNEQVHGGQASAYHGTTEQTTSKQSQPHKGLGPLGRPNLTYMLACPLLHSPVRACAPACTPTRTDSHSHTHARVHTHASTLMHGQIFCVLGWCTSSTYHCMPPKAAPAPPSQQATPLCQRRK